MNYQGLYQRTSQQCVAGSKTMTDTKQVLQTAIAIAIIKQLFGSGLVGYQWIDWLPMDWLVTNSKAVADLEELHQVPCLPRKILTIEILSNISCNQ